MCKYSDADVLHFIKEKYKIDMFTIESEIDMDVKNTYLEMHKYKIWQAPDGYWKTKLPNSDGKFTKLVKKKEKADVEDEIVRYYQFNQPQYTFKKYYDVWVERQRKCGRSDNTIYKYRVEYKRFFAGYPIENIDIRMINEETLSDHFCTVIKEKQIRWKALKGMFYNVSGVFKKAIKDRILAENPCDFVDLPLLQHLCYNPLPKSAKERTLSSKEANVLLDKIHHPKALNTNIVAGFAIEFAMYTGMRIGEIAALSWNDIDFEEGIITICHSEKRNRLTNEIYIDSPKNGKFRFFPITKEINELFNRITEYEKANGYYGEFVFQNKDGRLTSDRIAAVMRRKTRTPEFYNAKSIHTIRRTVNSNFKCNGISTTVASSLLGHTERVNEANYTYDIQDINLKRQMIENALHIN